MSTSDVQRRDVLSRNDILRLRSITQLLSITNGYQLDSRPLSLEDIRFDPKGRDEGSTYRNYTNAFARLLVREDENVTLTLQVPKRPKEGDPESDHAVITIAVRNAGKDESSPRDFPQEAVCQTSRLDGKGIPNGTSVTQYYVRNMANITASTHADNIVYFLRKLRTAGTPRETIQALTVLRRYVAISCCEKMDAGTYRREGENKRNFYTAITSDTIANCKEYCQWDTSRATPFSAEEFRTMQAVVAFLRRKTLGQGLENYPYQSNPWYDMDGRKAFQAVLSRLVKGYCKAVSRMVRRRSDRQTWGADSSYLDYVADQLVAWALYLELFHRVFGKRIYLHLDWVGRACKLNSALRVDLGTPLYHEYYDKATISETTKGRRKHTYADDNPEREVLSFLDEVSEEDWAEAGELYIRNLLVHVRALRYFAPNSDQLERESTDLRERHEQTDVPEILSEAEFRFLEGTMDDGDREMLPISELLRTSRRGNGQTRSKKTQQYIMGWINAQRRTLRLDSAYDFDATHFSGTVHPEAAMLGMQLLPQTKRPLELVVTTERCCPVCAYFFEFCKKRYGQGKVLGVDVDSDWSACSLPSWAPKRAGQYLLRWAERVLNDRLDTMVTRRKNDSQQDVPAGGRLLCESTTQKAEGKKDNKTQKKVRFVV